MLEVFSEQPSFLRIDASNDGASADPRAINQLLSHILKPSAAEHDGPPPGAATRTAPRRSASASSVLSCSKSDALSTTVTKLCRPATSPRLVPLTREGFKRSAF